LIGGKNGIMLPNVWADGDIGVPPTRWNGAAWNWGGQNPQERIFYVTHDRGNFNQEYF
jgi:hypothetical protein